MSKKLAAVFVAFTLCFSLFTVSAFAAEVPKPADNVPDGAIKIEYGLEDSNPATLEGLVDRLNEKLGIDSELGDWTYYQEGTYLLVNHKSAFVSIKGETQKVRVGVVNFDCVFPELEFPAVDAAQWQLYYMHCKVDNKDHTVALKVVDTREPVATFKSDYLVLNSSGDLTTEEGLDQLKKQICAGIVDTYNVPQEDLTEALVIKYQKTNLIGQKYWEPLDDGISTKFGTENTMLIRIEGNEEFKSAEHQFTLAFDNRVETQIMLTENASVVYEEDYAALEAAALEALEPATSGLPSDAELNIAYHTKVELSDTAKDNIENAIENSLDDLNLGLLKSTVSNALTSAVDKALANSNLDAWVPFAGGNVTISSEELGLADVVRKIPSSGLQNQVIEKLDAVLAKTDLELTYPPISVGDNEVRVSYTSASDANFTEYRPCTVGGTLTVKPATVKVSVASGSIFVDDSITGTLTATRTDGKPVTSVAGVGLYAGITSNAQALITLDFSDEVLKSEKYAPVRLLIDATQIDSENGVTLKELFSNTEKLESLRSAFEKLGLGDSFDTILKKALENALKDSLGENFDAEALGQLIDGAANGQLGEFLEKLKTSLGNGLDSVVENVGDSVIIRLGTPEGTAGAYAVAGYLSDEHYVTESVWDAHAAGYLLIKLHKVAVTVDGGTVAPDEQISNIVTVESGDAGTTDNIFAIYTGVTSGLTTAVYLDVPETAEFENVKTVGDLRAQMAANPNAFLSIVGVNSSFYAKALAAAAGLDNLDADIPVFYGKPEGKTGAYAVTALAYCEKNGKPWGYGVGAGTLTVGYGTIGLAVNSNTICVDGDPNEPKSLVEVDTESAKVYTVFAGIDKDGTPVVYIDGVDGAGIGDEASLNELVKYLADNSEKAFGEMGMDNATLAKLFSQLFAGDDVLGSAGTFKVGIGVPEGIGHYCVYAIAGGPGYIPAIAHGELSILPHCRGELIDSKPATCENDGFVEYTCTRCNDSVFEKIPALGHKSQDIPAVAATCTTAGSVGGKKCARCGEIYVEPTEIPAKGHDYVSTDEKAPSCSDKGLKRHTCTVCGDSYTTPIDLDPTAHTEVTVAAVAATCTETGLTEGKQCSVCKTMLVPQEPIEALGHETEVLAGTSATCTESGMTEGVRCTREGCKQVLQSQEAIPALGHESVVDEAILPQCTETGLTEGSHCSTCGITLTEQETVPAIGHAYGPWTVVREATAALPGSRERVCANNKAHVEQESVAYVAPAVIDGGGAGGAAPGAGGGAGAGTAGTAGTGAGAGVGGATGGTTTTEAAATIAENPTPRAQGIADDETPLAAGATGGWSLVSLICVSATIVLALVLAVRTVTGRSKAARAVIAAAIAVVSLVAFFVTSNFAAPMVAVNALTLLHVALLVGGGIAAVFTPQRQQQTA